MKSLFFLICLSSLSYLSCSYDKHVSSQVHCKNRTNFEFIEVDTLMMNNIINNYIADNLKDRVGDYALILNYYKKNDSIFLDIYYQLNLSSFIEDIPKYYSKVGEYVLFIKVNKKVSTENTVGINDSLIKITFPDQYTYYDHHGHFPPPITYSCEKRTYYNDILIRSSRF